MKLLLVFGVLIAALAFASASPSLRIYGGNSAVRNQFPYMVSVQAATLSIYSHRCGGAIVNEQYVVTAAQCTDGESASNMQIVAGILNLDDSGIDNQQTLGVSQIIIYPSYPGGGLGTKTTNDISLLKLTSKLNLGSNVAAIVIPTAALSVNTATVTGWGSTNALGLLTSETLKYADVSVISSTECQTTLKKLGDSNDFDTTDNLCTVPSSTGGQAPCGTGDVGGPLVSNNTLLGIISWGITPCGVSTNPYVYVNVTTYATWISENSV